MQWTCEWAICIPIVSWSYESTYSWNWCNCAQVYWNRSQSWERKMKGLRSCLKTSQLLADVLVLNPKSWLLKLKFNYQPPASCTNQIWGAITSESWDVDNLTFIGQLRMKDTCMICSTIETCCLKRASMIEVNILDPWCQKHCCYKCARNHWFVKVFNLNLFSLKGVDLLCVDCIDQTSFYLVSPLKIIWFMWRVNEEKYMFK